MTNRERYDAGLVMESNGASGEDIASALGYKDKKAWWQDKHLHKKREAKIEEMTPTERYLKGMEMDKAGSTPAEIAEALGYKNKEAWWAARCYFQNQAMTKRAAAAKTDSPEPAPILEGIRLEKVPVPVKPALVLEGLSCVNRINGAGPMERAMQNAIKQQEAEIKAAIIEMTAPPTFTKRLTIKKEINADGEVISYRAWDGNVSIRRRGSKDSSLIMSLSELHTMLAELGELIREVEGC